MKSQVGSSNRTTNNLINLESVSFLDQEVDKQHHKKSANEYITAKISYMQTESYRLRLVKSKLKAITRTSALLSGFAMVAMVELTLDINNLNTNQPIDKKLLNCDFNKTNASYEELNDCVNRYNRELLLSHNTGDYVPKSTLPSSILIVYSIVTCLLVGVHMLALMISTCLLPQIEAVTIESETYHPYAASASTALETAARSALSYSSNNGTFRKLDVFTSPEKKFHNFVEFAWLSSTVIGIFLFLVEVSLVCFIKFYSINKIASFIGSIFMLPLLVVFVVFTYKFYQHIAHMKLNLTKHVLSQVDHTIAHDHIV